MGAKIVLSKRVARLLKVFNFIIYDIPIITAFLDTGYDKKETVEIVKRMYKGKNINLNNQLFSLLLFEWVDEAIELECTDEDGKLNDLQIKERVAFSYNWNNKLYCKKWTTIRMKNVKKYEVGELYEIEWKDAMEEERKKYVEEIEDLKKKLAESKNLFT